MNEVSTLKNELSTQGASEEIITTLPQETKKDKVALYNAMNNADFSLKDFVGKKLEICDFVAHSVQMEDNQTGEIKTNVRIVFVDTKGKTYACTSTGVLSAMKKIIGIFGNPTKEEPYIIIPKMAHGRRYDYLTIELA